MINKIYLTFPSSSRLLDNSHAKGKPAGGAVRCATATERVRRPHYTSCSEKYNRQVAMVVTQQSSLISGLSFRGLEHYGPFPVAQSSEAFRSQLSSLCLQEPPLLEVIEHIPLARGLFAVKRFFSAPSEFLVSFPFFLYQLPALRAWHNFVRPVNALFPSSKWKCKMTTYSDQRS